VEKILKLAKQVAEEAEVYEVSTEETSTGFEANRLKNISSRQGTSVALRLIKNGRIGFAVSNHVDNSEELVRMAEEVSQFGAQAAFQLPELQPHNDVAVFDKNVEKVSLREMVKLGEGIISKVTSHTPDLIMEGRIGKSVTTVNILNSRGVKLTYSKSIASLMMEGNRVKGTDMLFVEELEVSCQPIQSGETVASSLIEQLDNSREIASIRTGSMPVIFTPKAIGSALLFALAQAFNGRVVLQGASPVGHRIGQQVFDKKFNLCDDATIAFRPASRPFDDEGTPSQCTCLVEEGAVARFFYDLQTAGLAKTRSTGNGSRMMGGLPAPFITALVIGKGSVPYKDLLQDIKEGLVVDMLMGAEQGNTLGGDFSGNVLLGYKVENGKLVGRVKDTMVSGNIYEALKDITLSKETRWVGGMLRTPSIFFPKLSVSTKH
jgi:PmbA protein